MSILESIFNFNQNAIIYGGTFILVLSVLVFIHEFGHYIVARWCGVKVEAFSIGFGKEIFGYNDKNGTRWKISLVPLGGYVKLFGDTDPASASHKETISDVIADSTTSEGEKDEVEVIRPMTPAERKVAFFAKPVWARAAVVFAGPAINYLFAILLMAVVFAFNGRPVAPPLVTAIVVDSSADKFNFQPHDEITAIQGKDIVSFQDIRREIVIALDDAKTFAINRGNDAIEIDARAEKIEETDRFGFSNSRGRMGLIGPGYGVNLRNVREIDGKLYDGESDLDAIIADVSARIGTTFVIGSGLKNGDIQRLRVKPFAEFNQNLNVAENKKYGLLFLGSTNEDIVVRYNVLAAFKEAVIETRNVTTGTLSAIGQIFTGTRSAKELGGVVRIGAVAGEMVQQGFIAMLLFTALLSINLGLINLFPIPLLDGGHLLFYFFEAVFRRPIPERIQDYAFQAGFVFLIGLIVFTNLNDLVQLIL